MISPIILRVLISVLFYLMLTYSAPAQTLLVLEKTGKFKTIKYYPGNKIMLKINDTLNVYGRITSLEDSILQINNTIEIELSRINAVYRERSLLQFISKGALVGGLTYFVLTGFNRSLNREYPILPASDIAISAGVMGGAMILSSFKYKQYHLGEKWQLKILDFSF